MKRNVLIIVLCLILVCIALFSGYKIVTTLLEYKAGTDAYQDLQQYVNVPDATEPAPSQTDSANTPTATQSPTEETVPAQERIKAPIGVDFDLLLDINSDVVGWIYLSGSKISFPVVQGEDNSEYLYRLINGDYNGAGTPFLDYRNSSDFTDPNTIIYGHNMNNGSMFADIHKYVDQEFFGDHPVIWLLTPERDYRIEVFAGYITGVDADAWKLDFETPLEFADWLQQSRDKSLFASSVIPTVEDRIVTISTCSNSANQTRFVLLGIIR